ncbi:MAG: PEP-CTERM sorting domain-containing protein [archaeon]
MVLRKTLATLAAGVVITAAATGTRADTTRFYDDFEDPNLPQWHSSGYPEIYHKYFEGEGVLCFGGGPVSEGGSTGFELAENPFGFEWDTYLFDPREDPGMSPRYRFILGKGDTGYNSESLDFIIWNSEEEHSLTLISRLGSDGEQSYTEYMSGSSNLLNKWLHSTISYTPEQNGNGSTIGLEINEGRGGGGEMILSESFNYDAVLPFDGGWAFTVYGPSSQTPYESYLDNVHVAEIPEASTIGLFGTGALALAASRRRREDED